MDKALPTHGRQTNHAARDVLLLFGISGILFLFQLGAAPLWDRDEPRNAGCAAEMLAAGDWVVPVFNADLRTHKPVLLYWLMMTSYAAFGVNEFAARLPSALLGVSTVLMTWQLGRSLFGTSQSTASQSAASQSGNAIGRWAGVMLASTIMFGVASRAATPDALLICCGALAITLFAHFSFRANREFPVSRVEAIAIYAAMGLGVLAKGPVGLVMPTAVIGMYLLIRRLPSTPSPTSWAARAMWLLRPFHPVHFLKTCWSMRPVTALATVAAISVPWYCWVALRTDGVWVREFIWTHNVSRATDVMEGHSGPPIIFYVGAILVGFFPWSILTIPTGLHVWSRLSKKPTGKQVATPTKEAVDNSQVPVDESQRHERDAITLLLCWVGVYVGLFSLAQTKLPSYVTPCYPALALLGGLFVQEWSRAVDCRRVWLRVGIGNLIAVGVILLAALPVAARFFLPGSEWLGVIGFVPLVGGICCWRYVSQRDNQRATFALATTAVAFSVLLMGVVPAEIGRHQKYAELYARAARHNGPIAAWGHLEPSWIFYGGKPIREFHATDPAAFLTFLEQHPNALVITTPEKLQEKSQDKFPADFRHVYETEYFLRDRPLLLGEADLPAKSFVAERADAVRK